MNSSVVPISPVRAVLRYLSCLRPEDIVVLQGPPLLGALFALRQLGRHQISALAILTIANVLLVTHIFMLNDWSGLSADLADQNKAGRVFTARGVGPRAMGGVTACVLVLSLFLFGGLGPITLSLSLGIAALSALYSMPPFDWKGKPFLNSAAHLTGGILHFLLGYSVGRSIDGRGLAIAAFFALIFAAGHMTQEVRDHQGDAVSGIRTNAVVFGRQSTFAGSLVLFTLAQGLLLFLALKGILPRPLATLVVLYPVQLYWSVRALGEGLTYASVSRLQTRYRLLYALVGVAMVAARFDPTIAMRWWRW